MLFIHLDINSLLPTIKKMCHLAELTNSSLKGISETKLDGSVLNSEIATERVMILSGQIKLEKVVVLLVLSSSLLPAVMKPVCALSPKVFLQRYIYQNQDHLQQISNIIFLKNLILLIEIHSKLTLLTVQIKSLVDLIQLKPKNVTSVSNKKHQRFCLPIYFEQIITSPTWTTDRKATLTDHVLASSSHKFSQSGVSDLDFSDRDLMFCTQKDITTKIS